MSNVSPSCASKPDVWILAHTLALVVELQALLIAPIPPTLLSRADKAIE
jgi:hypothetical protein